MSAGPDFTRWNRAGLSRFRYVDANARVFLEQLRAALGTRFPEWTGLAQRSYDEPSTDWSWEIARAFARACHVLGEHVDAYANEGYLRTATQWDSVRKLVGMLDVRPAPPASASTALVLDASSSGTLAAGFAVRYTPADGAPIVFETLEEIAIDPSLDLLHLSEWDASPAPLINLPPTRPLPRIAQRSARVIQGVGPQYQALLDTRAPLASGLFRVADFRAFLPTDVRLWEAKSKAEVLLDFPWTTGEFGAIGRLRIAELLEVTPRNLADRTGRTTADMERFLDDLRGAAIALDEDVYRSARLEDLLSPGDPPPAPRPLWIAPEDSGISAGQVAIVVHGSDRTPQAAVVRVSKADSATHEIVLEAVAHQPPFESWTRGTSHVLAKPQVIAVAHLAGSPNSVTFTAPHGLNAGDQVAWSTQGTWRFARVEKADDVGLLVAGPSHPPAGAEVFRAVDVDGVLLPLGYRAAATPVANGLQVLATHERIEEKDNAGVPRLYRVTRQGVTRFVFVPGAATPAGRVAAAAAATSDGRFRFGGKPGEFESGQWVVGDDRGRLLALRVSRIETFEDHFAVSFESVVDPIPRIATLPVSAIMGVGPVVSRRLIEARLPTIGELAAISPTQQVFGLTRTTRLEARAKAQLVTTLPFSARDLEPILIQSLPAVLGTTADAVADTLGKPTAWTEQFLEAIRLVQAVIDEPTVATLTVRDLLSIGAPRPVKDYELTRLDRLYGVFEHTIRPTAWNVNATPVSGARLPLALPPPTLLARGRRLVLERPGHAREARVVVVDPTARTVDVTPPVTEAEGFTRHNLTIRANVSRAGHGETKPEKVLGSGDATRRSQTFVLNETDVSFVSDPTQPAGVAAAVQVIVAGQTWQQVGTLRDSAASDPHYEVRLTEGGHVSVIFGDGTHGRRLPTGTNNVRVRFRIGAGLEGNVPPGSLTRPVRPHPRVRAVEQPLAATGGNDREDVASLKVQAPKSVLTLERAVSLADFEALAARQASVWQARAFALPTRGGRHASLEVVVVPAGGGSLGAVAADLTAFLTTHALPGIEVRVSPYTAKPFDLAVEIEVKSAEFDRDEVRKAVETTLLDTFGLRLRALGASLFASELYEVVEGVPGVESSRVRFGIGRVLAERVVRAAAREVIFLDPVQSQCSVSVREFEL